ncbi:MAG: 16S rRNA (guanine(527)-N(7))-methyltransferase RsmG, partial [Pseudomonadota bacterium]
ALSGVSRETSDRLGLYLDLLRRWNRTINLVGPSTLSDPWRRHILDSTQLAPMLPTESGAFVDLGSGAGLPGVPLALAAPGWRGTLIESDGRKAAFIREAARATGADIVVRNARIESVVDLKVDVATARALAPLSDLIQHARRCLADGGICLFLKGRRFADELTESTRRLIVSLEARPSATDDKARILRVVPHVVEDGQKNGD